MNRHFVGALGGSRIGFSSARKTGRPYRVAGALVALSACARQSPPAPVVQTVPSMPVCPSSSVVGAPLPVAPLAHGDSVDAGKGQGTPSTADLAALDQRFVHFLPGADDPTLDERRTRKQNAVLLVAPPSKADPQPGIARAETIRFQPVLCSIAGKLATGSRCGEIMPGRTTLRITDPGLYLATKELVVSRSSAQPADADGKKLAPPYAPACCMYNGCFGKTIPYYPVEDSPDSTLTNSQTILAVWPKDAEIGLAPSKGGVAPDVRLDDAPWTTANWKANGGRLANVAPLQAFARNGRRYASLGAWPMDGVLFVDSSSGWQVAFQRFAVMYLLATSDVDGDGRPELLVYESWVNDYGLDVLANDETTPAYHFSCGNI
jgi:hypothetical protein